MLTILDYASPPALVNVDRWLPLVLPAVPAAPTVAALQEIRRALAAFCEETRVWQGWMRTLDVWAGEPEYRIPVPDDAAVVIVERVVLTGQTLTFRTPKQLEEAYPDQDWAGLAPTDAVAYWTQMDPHTVRLVPPPQATVFCGLSMRLLLKPQRDADVVPGFLWEDHADAVAWKAVAELAGVPGQPWTSGETAAYYLAKAQQAFSEAGRDADRQFARPRRTVRSHY